MIFFTDITTKASNYCMLNIKDYNSKSTKNKKLTFVDPSVYELKDNIEFSKIDLLHDLASGRKELRKNEYISIDYPCDMNIPNSALFVQKSIDNNIKYKDNPKYICAIQSNYGDFKDFKKRFDELKPVFYNKNKIVGIGNLCRIMHSNEFTDKVFGYLLRHRSGIKWLHFYGLSMRLIKKYIPKLEGYSMKISVDSTKWTRACSLKLKTEHGLSCSGKNRDLYFLEYIKSMKKKVKKVIY